jgi:uncharacterized protein YjbI with pentapeptide repeats
VGKGRGRGRSVRSTPTLLARLRPPDGTDLGTANLHRGDLSWETMQGTLLRRTLMTEAEVSGANLSGAGF